MSSAKHARHTAFRPLLWLLSCFFTHIGDGRGRHAGQSTVRRVVVEMLMVVRVAYGWYGGVWRREAALPANRRLCAD